MAYGQKPKCFGNGSLGAKSRIEMCQTTIPERATNKRIHICSNRSRTQANGVG